MSNSLHDYLEQMTLAELVELDTACERVRLDREKGGQSELASFLVNASESNRSSMLLELVRTELEFRLSAGESPNVEEYTTRYPECAETLPRVFAEQCRDFSATKTHNVAALAPKSPQEDGELLVGTELGHYRVAKIIGQGGMGLVLEARDTKLDRDVAIKLPSLNSLSEIGAKERFVREAKIAAAVRHENIVTIYGVDESNVRPFLVMERIEGCSLEHYVRTSGPLSSQVVMEIGYQLASGLAAAHRFGLVHHDIKPSNVLVESGREHHEEDGSSHPTSQLRVKLTDFGLARKIIPTLHSSESSNDPEGGSELIGTPLYMSPEQAKGLPTDASSDLFSLGSLLYFLCTGRHAFASDSMEGVLDRVKEARANRLGTLCPDAQKTLIDLIERLMEKSPSNRPASAEIVCRELRRMRNEGLHQQTRWNNSRLTHRTGVVLLTLFMLGTIATIAIVPTILSEIWTRTGRSSLDRATPMNERKSEVAQPITQWITPSKVLFEDGDSDGSNPTLTEDGLRLFFVSHKRGPGKIFEAVRNSVESPFGVPSAVAIKLPIDEAEGREVEEARVFGLGTPCISKDGLILYFYAFGPGGKGRSDLWQIQRATLQSDWGPMQNLGDTVNTNRWEYAPNVSSDGLTIHWFQVGPEDIDDANIWMATRSNVSEPFGDAVQLPSKVNTATNEQHPCLSNGGRRLYFDRGTPEPRLWQVDRNDPSSEYGESIRVPLPLIWSDLNAYAPTVALDGKLLMFTSNRVPGKQGFETGVLWQSWTTSVNAAEPK